jgi:hypothetical protein
VSRAEERGHGRCGGELTWAVDLLGLTRLRASAALAPPSVTPLASSSNFSSGA